MRLYKGKHNHNSGKSVNYFLTNMKDAKYYDCFVESFQDLERKAMEDALNKANLERIAMEDALKKVEDAIQEECIAKEKLELILSNKGIEL